MSAGGGGPARRRRDGGHSKPNHERWMISYADMLTLLLAVFIILWATSHQSKYKLREVAEGMLQAFQGTPPALIPMPSSPHGPMHAMSSPIPRPLAAQNVAHVARPLVPRATQSRLQPSLLAMKKLLKKLDVLLEPEITSHRIQVLTTPLTIRIRLNARILFRNGDARLTAKARSVLGPLAHVLAKIPKGYMITVQGYTDNVPIHTAEFPSNWQLSASRAMSVLLLLRDADVRGKSLGAEGFGQYHPIASNKTSAGRSANRRVEIVITAPRRTDGGRQSAGGRSKAAVRHVTPSLPASSRTIAPPPVPATKRGAVARG